MRRLPLFLLTLMAAGCFREMPSEEPPIHLEQNMFKQAKVRPQAESLFFDDGAAMRPAVPGTLARGFLREDDRYYRGVEPNGEKVKKAPIAITPESLRRGRERFSIYCAPCHGQVGTGRGIVVEKGLPPPTSYHDPRLVQEPDGHYFDVITNGLRNMPSYASQVPVEDRWKIIQYIRALQRSQNAKPEDVPPEIRQNLTAEGQKP